MASSSRRLGRFACKVKKQLLTDKSQKAQQSEDESMDTEDIEKHASNILEGGQDVIKPKLLPSKYGIALTEDEIETIGNLKKIPFKKEDQEAFFRQDCVYQVGLHSPVLVRLGIDAYQCMWKIYLKRCNFSIHKPDNSPSILDFHFGETKDVIQILNEILVEVQKSFASNVPAYKPTNFPYGSKPPQPDDHDFWTGQDASTTESGSIRIRPVWQPGNIHLVFLNSPREYKDPDLQFKSGPKIRLTIPDVRQLLITLEDILKFSPPFEKLMALAH